MPWGSVQEEHLHPGNLIIVYSVHRSSLYRGPTKAAMADALGLVSSIIAVVDLFIKVGVQCSIYCSGVKDAPRDIRQILNEADRTTATLEDLRRLLASPTGARLSSSQRVCQSIEDARLQLQDLAFKLEGGLRTGQRLRWPLRKEEVAGIISQLQKCRASIALDLQVDQTYVRYLDSSIPACLP